MLSSRRRSLWMLLLVSLSLALGCGGAKKPRVVVIGLDGATWDLIEPWIESGELPNLKSLRERSAWGSLNSVIPYLSPPAWTSAITGVNPGRHGIFDFQRRLPGQDKIVTETANSRRVEPIWMWLKAHKGPKCAVINVPMTAPPDEVDGVMVSGLPHLDQAAFAYPPEFQAQLESEGYRAYLDRMEMKIPDGEEQQVFDGLMGTLHKRWELVRRTYAEGKYDFFWVVFTETDRVQHMFWKFDDPANPNYKADRAALMQGSIKKLWLEQDRILGEFLKLIPADTWVLVLSDHGFGPMHHELRMGNYLRSPESGITSDEADEVFCLDRSDAARLYVRRAGSDPGDHFLSRPERRSLRDRVAEASLRAIDPATREHPVEHAFPDTAVFVGTQTEKGPYLTLLPSPGWYLTLGDHDLGYKLPPYGNISSTLSGWHRMNGIYMLAGPAVVPGKNAHTYSLLDVVPTLLYLMQQPIPEDAEGSVMEGLFAPSRFAKRKPERKGFLDEENRQLSPEEEQRIKNLPYMGG